MSMEIIKQLYDIGNLADKVSDIETIKSTFKIFAATELSYRELDNLTEQDVIGEPMNTKLNRLKKSNPEAFFYWHKISQMLKTDNNKTD